ncbi:Ltp family lipoprotein [Eggerthella sp. YY7918]|uniref:Ltp family lipoprotein n=1 Tax=Eggerthella sp. (strain YY7918) TaxID=502558 RepID=UPI000217178A|nr:Ltp family lipoprotein [Eggerthella sp. YY7918]BAK44506.1 hypothetical protein EGYY_13540 [Eggerthella sp. YY7918]
MSTEEGKPKSKAGGRKPFYKAWWFWAIVIVVVIGAGAMAAPKQEEKAAEPSGSTQTENVSTSNTDTPSEKVEETPAEPEVPAEYKSALKKAQTYSDTMYMSKAGLFNQLTSEYGEKFSTEAAQYAIDNVSADWNANALAKAKQYQDQMAMSPEAIRDQLTSEYGEQFTQEEADYAIANL